MAENMSSPAKTHSRRSREHPVGASFICLSVLEMKKTKKQNKTKNSIILSIILLYFKCLEKTMCCF